MSGRACDCGGTQGAGTRAREASEVFIVTAHEFGSRNHFSYIVGVYAQEPDAIRTADETDMDRGGRFTCEVRAFPVASGWGVESRGRIVRMLPESTRPVRAGSGS